MVRLGSYSTIDCPTELIDEAFEFLSDRFAIIGGTVRKVWNDHDFGPYPSFEVDYPEDLEYVDEWMEDSEDPEDQKLLSEKDNFVAEADKIETEYNNKFSLYL